jgi:hypothetical protein
LCEQSEISTRSEAGEWNSSEKDNDFQEFKKKMFSKVGTDFREGENGMMYFREQIFIPNNKALRKQILDEANNRRYSIHPGEVKMYRDFKRVYWWPGMKRDVMRYVSTCLTYQKVKAEHKKVARLL